MKDLVDKNSEYFVEKSKNKKIRAIVTYLLPSSYICFLRIF
ncbi:hypothetical protein KX02_987 [Francisella tularensis subsp. novicida]|nr:hypothetical protein KX02_987 [Francisella tularensis subsp. novicida]